VAQIGHFGFFVPSAILRLSIRESDRSGHFTIQHGVCVELEFNECRCVGDLVGPRTWKPARRRCRARSTTAGPLSHNLASAAVRPMRPRSLRRNYGCRAPLLGTRQIGTSPRRSPSDFSSHARRHLQAAWSWTIRKRFANRSLPDCRLRASRCLPSMRLLTHATRTPRMLRAMGGCVATFHPAEVRCTMRWSACIPALNRVGGGDHAKRRIAAALARLSRPQCGAALAPK